MYICIRGREVFIFMHIISFYLKKKKKVSLVSILYSPYIQLHEQPLFLLPSNTMFSSVTLAAVLD